MTKIIRMERKNESKDRKKTLQALLYVVIGLAIFAAAVGFAIYMWLSGTFLANQLILRKVLYVIAFLIGVLGVWFFSEGARYLSNKKKRR